MNKLMTNERSLRVWAVLVFGISLVLNGLASTTLLGGNTTAQVSDSYPNLFAPAGVTFAIWGVIYLLLIGYCTRLFTNFKQKNSTAADTLGVKITPLFIAISALNAVWIVAWQYRVLWLSVLLIVAMLVVLARIALALKNAQLTRLDWATIKLPFSIYFGWITIATIANITTWLVSIGWSGWGVSPVTWMLFVVSLGALIGIVTAWRLKNWAYLLVFVWAYFGIWLKHTSAEGFNNQYPAVINLLLPVIAALALMAIYIAFVTRRTAQIKQ